MLMSDLLSKCFEFLAILASLSVIFSKNPVHSIFYLVLTFINVSMLLLTLGVEFLAFLFLIVYVGAIAILFLFVIMLLNIRLVELLDNNLRYIPIGLLISFVFFADVFNVFNVNIQNSDVDIWSIDSFLNYSIINYDMNIVILGNILYTDYFMVFLISGLVLLLAMIAAILLTMSHEENIKRQDIFTQINRNQNVVLMN